MSRHLAALPAGKWITDPNDPGFQSQWTGYGKTLAINTVGGGVGLAVVLWLLMFVLMIIFCCRCCKLRRIDREIQDGKGFHYDQTGIAYKAAKHRRILWFGTLLIFLFYIACAGYAYKETLAVKTSFDKAYKGSDTFMTNLQNALCTLDGADTCADKSLGDFLHDVLGELTGVLDGILAWFLSLGSLSAPLSTIAAYYSTLSTQYTTVNASFVAGRAARTNIAAVINKAEYNRYGLAVSLPTITNINIAEFGGAKDAITETALTVTDAQQKLYNATLSPDSDISKLGYQIDAVKNNERNGDKDLRDSIEEVVDKASDKLRGLTKDIYKIQTNEAVDVNDYYQKYAKPAGMAIAGLVFLPALVLLLLSACSAMCRSPKPFYVNMFFVFAVQWLYCIWGGGLLLISQLSSDICTSHEGVLTANFNKQVSIVENSSFTLGTAIVAVLECNGTAGDAPTESNNLVNILGLSSLFDISGPLNDTANQIRDKQPLIQQQKDLVTGVRNATENLFAPVLKPDVPTMRTGYTLTGAQTSVSTRRTSLPPDPFDRIVTAQVNKFQTEYLAAGRPNAPGFSWADYQTTLAAFNTKLNALDFSTVDTVGDTYYALYLPYSQGPLDANDVATIVASTFCAAAGPFYSTDTTTSDLTGVALYTGTEAADLCTAAQNLATETGQINTLVALNAEYLGALLAVDSDLLVLDSSLVAISAVQVNATATLNTVNTALDELPALVDVSITRLNSLAGEVMDINLVTEKAPEYAMCGYVGKFYKDVYIGSVCKGFNSNLRGIGAPMIAVAIIAFISYFLHGCCGPALRSRPGTVVPVQDDEHDENKKGGYYPTNNKQQHQPILGTDAYR